MCGIAGFTHLRKPLPAGVLTDAVDAITHRGPNQKARFECDEVSLGATRLAILDIAGGDQPIYSADRDAVIVYNGEVFNFVALREELEREGIRFHTHCDTEVILQAFLRWGDASFARLRGMFAIAIWVQSKRRLVLARDRMGIKPLYFYQQDGELYFGSELKCIFAHPDVPRRISLAGLNCYLSLNYVPAPYTLVDGIIKLLPGDMLEWKEGVCSTRSYLPPKAKLPPPTSLDAACEQLDELLQKSVREELVSDVPLGVWLSGGLDSSTILHYAANASPNRIHTFGVTFQGRSFDESRYIREVSRHFGTNHTEFDLNTDAELSDAIQQIAYYSDEPSADAGAVPLWFLARMTAQDVTVILTGEGGDELFAGYLTYRANRYREIAHRFPSLLLKAALAAANFLPVSDDKISFEYKLKRFLQGSLMDAGKAHLFWNGTFSDEEKNELFHCADPRPLAGVLSDLRPGKGLARFLEFDQRYYLADDILYKVDRISMAHSLEVRPPFLDDRIVDFANGLPDDFKLRGSESKYVLRRLMQNKLPRSVLHRPKIGFDIPIHEWFRGVLRPLLLETLSEEAIKATGLFRWPYVRRLLDDHLERRANLGYHLWGLLVLFIWMKRWNIETVSGKAEAARVVTTVGTVGSSSPQPA
ncbi:MAG TPA: asparagine synthase (glutamine-hydrolyzing) [Candidatus Eisenbacteria bacterium]|nr:asparagine synthase (glutamine-hydrolyzing) [Candidatus Eisenbacteria bacterium]